MKVFLLFLFVSFIVGIQFQDTSPQRRRWIMASIAIVTGLSYFLFDGSI